MMIPVQQKSKRNKKYPLFANVQLMWLCLLLLPHMVDADSLKTHFKDDFLIGAAVGRSIVEGDTPLANELVSKHFNTLTVENDMKAEVVSPQRGQYDFSRADAFIDYAKARNAFVIGHTLIWHNQTPSWFFKNEKGEPFDEEEQSRVLNAHIKVMAERYLGRVHAWDVLNEIIDDDGSYRPTIWVEQIGGGDKLAKMAFRAAQKYAPNTELYYNDFNAWKPGKVKGIVRMIRMLKKEGIRIDGIGIQGHWGLNYPSISLIEEAIDAYAAEGVKVMISEIDIDVLPITKEGQVIGSGLLHKQFQEPEFEAFLDPYKENLPTSVAKQLDARWTALFSLFKRKSDAIDRVTFWGVDDSTSWKNDYPVTNRTNYPLLWNRDFSPKGALEKILTL